MVSDPVADALIRIKNGYLSHKGEVLLNYSKLVSSICAVLQKEGFIDEIKEDKSAGITNKIVVTLKYESRKPVLTEVQRVSKPGLRVYRGKKSLPWVLNGLGIALISTPKGIMTDKQARKEGLGGEVMALVW
jgi:small subunit ribosomal protein S8